jgi:hypothetical protein
MQIEKKDTARLFLDKWELYIFRVTILCVYFRYISNLRVIPAILHIHTCL